MAKYGEGDSRWIVSDRADGTNVHNWHWSETNCFDWSKNYLTSLLSNKTLLDGNNNMFVSTKKIDRFEGEAYVNVRKGKIIPGYEISFNLKWEGEAKDGQGNLILKVDGNVEVPYIADENADEDPEVKVRVSDEGPVGKVLKEAFVEKGKPFVLEQIRAYVAAMAKGGPCKEDLEVKKPAAKKEATAATGEEKKEEAKKKVEVKKKKGKEGFKTISMSEKFSCRARDMYEILMDENRWKGFTQSNAKISKEVGGEFIIFDGAVSGVNVELQEGKLIVQKWRFGSWTDGVFSTVRISLEELESGLTVVKLTQTDVPEEDRYGNATVVENTEKGWRDLIFHKIRAVFGFGI